MHAWFIHPYLIPSHSAGINRYHALAQELIGRGHGITLFGAHRHHRQPAPLTLPPGASWHQTMEEDVPVVWFRGFTSQRAYSRRILNMLAMARMIRRAPWASSMARPDLIMGNMPDPFGAYASLLLARRLGVPFVLQLSDIWPETLVQLGGISPRHPLILLMARLQRIVYREAAAIATTLPYAHEQVAKEGGDPEKVHWIPNGIALNKLPSPAPFPPSPPLHVLYAGALGEANHIDKLLQAIARANQLSAPGSLHYTFLGEGQEKPHLIELARELSLENVSFKEAVPKKELPSHLAAAHAFMIEVPDLPLYRYGIAMNKLNDYMAAARPVVIACSARNNPVAEYEAGFCVPGGDTEALAQAFAALPSVSEEELARLGENGRRKIEEYHDYPRLGAALEEVLADVISS